MSVRERAWVVHGIICFVVLTAVGTWAALIVHDDHDSFRLGSLIAAVIVSAAAVHVLVATALVAAWGQRPATVALMHLVGAGIAMLLLMSMCR